MRMNGRHAIYIQQYSTHGVSRTILHIEVKIIRVFNDRYLTGYIHVYTYIIHTVSSSICTYVLMLMWVKLKWHVITIPAFSNEDFARCSAATRINRFGGFCLFELNNTKAKYQVSVYLLHYYHDILFEMNHAVKRYFHVQLCDISWYRSEV